MFDSFPLYPDHALFIHVLSVFSTPSLLTATRVRWKSEHVYYESRIAFPEFANLFLVGWDLEHQTVSDGMHPQAYAGAKHAQHSKKPPSLPTAEPCVYSNPFLDCEGYRSPTWVLCVHISPSRALGSLEMFTPREEKSRGPGSRSVGAVGGLLALLFQRREPKALGCEAKAHCGLPSDWIVCPREQALCCRCLGQDAPLTVLPVAHRMVVCQYLPQREGMGL